MCASLSLPSGSKAVAAPLLGQRSINTGLSFECLWRSADGVGRHQRGRKQGWRGEAERGRRSLGRETSLGSLHHFQGLSGSKTRCQVEDPSPENGLHSNNKKNEARIPVVSSAANSCNAFSQLPSMGPVNAFPTDIKNILACQLMA